MAAPSGRAPLDADATRGRHFRAIVGGRWFVLPVALVGTAGFVYGASQGSVLLMGAALPVAALAGLVISYLVADRQAETDFFTGYAAQRGFQHSLVGGIFELTPLLGAGHRRRVAHHMRGEFRGVPFQLFHFTYEIRRGPSDEDAGLTQRFDPHHFTICVVDMEDALRTFPGFFMRAARGLLGKLGDDEWLSGRGFPRVQLESIRFSERYELYRDRAMDERMLRQLFSPSLVQWLSEHPLCPGVEFKAGTLVVFLDGHVTEAGRLDWLLEAAVELTRRIAREVAEAAQRA